MTLDEILSHFNTTKMRNQLSDINLNPGMYNYGINNPIPLSPQSQLSAMKEEYRNAQLMGYAEKLDLLLEAQESGIEKYVSSTVFDVYFDVFGAVANYESGQRHKIISLSSVGWCRSSFLGK